MAQAEAADPAEFARRMVHMLNEAALALMVSVGHRTGLFDVMAAMPAAISALVAAAAAAESRTRRSRSSRPSWPRIAAPSTMRPWSR